MIWSLTNVALVYNSVINPILYIPSQISQKSGLSIGSPPVINSDPVPASAACLAISIHCAVLSSLCMISSFSLSSCRKRHILQCRLHRTVSSKVPLTGMRFGISFNIFVSVIGIVLLLNDDHVMTLEQLQKVKDIFFGLLVRNVIV